LPYSGVTTVIARRYEVTTHERWFSPPSSPTMVGSAVDTIVWSSAASSMVSMSAPTTARMRRPSTGSAAGLPATALINVFVPTRRSVARRGRDGRGDPLAP
jgi:uncharacterized PurR-regulated membrane protein YhhQ (DUF165 family)